MPHNKPLLDRGGFLASLLFLKQEALRDGLKNTEYAIEHAIEVFFEDLEKTGGLDQDLIIVRDFLLKAMALNDSDLMKFVDLIQSIDAESSAAPLH